MYIIKQSYPNPFYFLPSMLLPFLDSPLHLQKGLPPCFLSLSFILLYKLLML